MYTAQVHNYKFVVHELKSQIWCFRQRQCLPLPQLNNVVKKRNIIYSTWQILKVTDGGGGSKMEECYIQVSLTTNQNMSNTTYKWNGRELRAYFTSITSALYQTTPLPPLMLPLVSHPVQF